MKTMFRGDPAANAQQAVKTTSSVILANPFAAICKELDMRARLGREVNRTAPRPPRLGDIDYRSTGGGWLRYALGVRTILMASKSNVYAAEYHGSGTFHISKPKRKKTKLKEIRAKRTSKRSRRS